MIKYFKHNEIDIKKWDNCINKSFNGIPYALSWFLDLVHEEWEALVEDDYVRVMPITGRKKFGVQYLFQPYFAQQLGVFSTSVLTPDILSGFIGKIPKNYKFTDIKLNSFNQFEKGFAGLEYNKNHVLDLIHDHPKIQQKYSSQTKRNLKKSQKSSLSLMKNIKPEAVIKLFRENRGEALKKWNDQHYNTLQRLMYSAIFKGKGVVFGVFNERNELCAGAFFLKGNGRLIFLFSGLDEYGRERAAMTFLIDSVIQEFTPSQLILDFEGSNDPNLARFYKGFGSKEIEYPGFRQNKLGFPVRQLFSLYRMLKKN